MGDTDFFSTGENNAPPPMTVSDQIEWGRMQAYTPAPQGQEAAPWWSNLVSYGVTKAIDNTFPNQNIGIQGNTYPGTFAGQNGRTYSQVGGLNAAPTSVGGLVNSLSQMSPLVLAAIAVGAYLLLRK